MALYKFLLLKDPSLLNQVFCILQLAHLGMLPIDPVINDLKELILKHLALHAYTIELLKSVRGEVPHGLDLTLKIDGITCL